MFDVRECGSLLSARGYVLEHGGRAFVSNLIEWLLIRLGRVCRIFGRAPVQKYSEVVLSPRRVSGYVSAGKRTISTAEHSRRS